MINRFLLCMMLVASIYTLSGSNALSSFDADRYKELKTAEEKGILQKGGKAELESLESEKAKFEEKAKEEAKIAEEKAKEEAKIVEEKEKEEAEKNKFIAKNIREKAHDAAKRIENKRAEVIGAMIPDDSDFVYSTQKATEKCLLKSLLPDPNMKECNNYVTDEDIADFKKEVLKK